MGLFGRRRPAAVPAEWHELWAALAPLRGRLDPSGLQLVRERILGMTEDEATRLEHQLGQALALLDTEEHARHLHRDAWTGPREVFGRRRFVRAVTAVIAAGPEWVERVAADPAQIRGFDSAHVPGLPERARKDPLGETIASALAGRDEMFISDIAEDLAARELTGDRGWKSLRPILRSQFHYSFEIYDPEGVWLELLVDYVQVENIVGDDGTQLFDDSEIPHRRAEAEAWRAAATEATAHIVARCGAGAPDRIGAVPPTLGSPTVDKVRLDSWLSDETAGQAPEVDPTDGELDVDVQVSTADIAAASGDKVRFVVQHAAQVLLDAMPDLTPAGRDLLKGLAAGHD